MRNYRQCIPQLFVYFCLSSRSQSVLHFRKEESCRVCVLRGFCLDLKACRFCSPSQSHILTAPTFSTSDVTITHPHVRSAVAKEPKGVKPCCVMTFRRQGNFFFFFLLFCSENLFSNNRRSFCICVCFFAFGPRSYSPPTDLRRTVCVLQWEMSHML